jgi:phage terminase large subunit
MPMIAEQFGYSFSARFKQSDKSYQHDKGIMNFIAMDKIGKAHGGRRHIIFFNEANFFAYKIAEQIIVRTREVIFIDYNPTTACWIQSELLAKHPEKCLLIKTTYKDNDCLSQLVVDAIEEKRGDNNFWRVYGLGEFGVSEGLVFNNFEVKEFDLDVFETYRYGIDWGFSIAKFAFVEVAIQNNVLYVCNEIYEKKILNKVSARLVKKFVTRERVICDNSEPKSIEEYKSYRVNAVTAKKGRGSLKSGIKFIQSFDKVIIHPQCKNTYNEFRNYHWQKDRNGEDTVEPIDSFNDIIDAIRYALEDEMIYNKTIIEGASPF